MCGQTSRSLSRQAVEASSISIMDSASMSLRQGFMVVRQLETNGGVKPIFVAQCIKET